MAEDEAKQSKHAEMSRTACELADRIDPLAALRQSFFPGDAGILYFDANSVGPMPTAARTAMDRIADEWRSLRRRGWTRSNWLDAPTRLGDKLSPLLGAAPGQVLVSDSTSINLHKALSLALSMAGNRARVITQAANFPSDLYVAEGLAAALPGVHLQRVHGAEDAIEQAIEAACDEAIVVYLSHTDYRSGVCLDMSRLCAASRQAGALTVWDLSHSAGARHLGLDACGADFAVGCGYKYLCGGPGAPGYLYVATRHQGAARPAPWGWMGHADQFAFAPEYRAAEGMRAHRIGTPSVLAEAVFETAIDVWAGIDLVDVWQKREALAALLIDRASRWGRFGLEVLTPVEGSRQGGFVALRHPDAEALCDALDRKGLVCSRRPPDVLRFGLSPLAHRHVDVWDACDILETAMAELAVA